MSLPRGLAARIYRILLSIYPPDFRTEFGSEMLAVFTNALAEAGYDTTPGATILLWREICDWPVSVWRAHLEGKESNRMKSDVPNTNDIPTPWEMLGALAVFCLPIISLLLSGIPQWGGIIFLGTIGAVLIIGTLKGFPRWSVPSLGIVIFAFSILSVVRVIMPKTYQWWMSVLGPMFTWNMTARVFNQALQSGMVWLLALLGAILAILLLFIWPRTRTLAHSIRDDWTVLSFLLYGGVVFSILVAYEEYRYDSPWKIAAWLCLAAGAWAYLRLQAPSLRIFTLLAGVTLAYWITALSKLLITPMQDWPVSPEKLATYTTQGFWAALVEWILVLFFLLVPVLLTLLPRRYSVDSTPDETLIRA